ncbi:MAG: glycosyltransferase family 10 [Candidatus Paceibacterota bacterium]
MPKYFDWCRTSQNNICFFTDYCLSSATTTQAVRKIAWLLEPPAMYRASYDYIQKNSSQFDYILTYDRTLVDGKKILFYPCGGCWIPSIGDQRTRPHTVGIHQKRQLVSIVASDKTQTSGHRLRHAIINRYPHISSFGPRYRAIQYKEDALIDFMFSVVVENSKFDDYFTEKLIDCFAVGTIPIYWGTKNVERYFDIGGIFTFNDLNDLDKIITKLSSELYNNHISQVRNNFYRHHQYRVAEDWIFEQYPYLFSI